MYSSIPDPQAESRLPIDTNMMSNDDDFWQRKKKAARSILTKSWAFAFALTCLFFGIYMICFYWRSMLENRLDAWDIANRGMYHEGRWDSNWLLGMHLIGGAYMMALGPLQFVASIRRNEKTLWIHRWNGRLTIAGAFLAALGGMYQVCTVGMTLAQYLGKPANWSNFAFGMSFLVCAAQTYRHAAWTKQIDRHKLWAYRLTALCFGNIFLRIYILVVFNFMDSDGVPAQAAFHILVYIFFPPFLILAGEIWKREQHPDDETLPSLISIALTALLLVLFVVLATLQILWNWIPYINFRSFDSDHWESNHATGELVMEAAALLAT